MYKVYRQNTDLSSRILIASFIELEHAEIFLNAIETKFNWFMIIRD